MNKLRALVLGLLAFATLASATPILNPSFELPPTVSFSYNPVDPTGGWTFAGRSGVAQNTFFVGPPPDGTQAAFIQQYLDQPVQLSSISQAITGLSLAPTTLTFYIAQRPGNAADPIVVTYGSQNLGTFTPASTAFALITINFTPTATSGTLTFQSAATTNSDLDTAIDLVDITSVPEPATLALVLPVLGALFLSRRRCA